MSTDNPTDHKDSIMKGSILVVDDESSVCKALSRMLGRKNYICETANSAAEALEILPQVSFDIVITDLSMPDMNGLELTHEINEKYPDIAVIMMTGFFRDFSFSKAISLGASDFLEKPIQFDELEIRIQRVLNEHHTKLQLKESLAEVETILDGVVNSLSAIVESRDPYTSGHQLRVAQIATSIGTKMGLSESELRAIHVAGVIHDLGKIAIPAEILAKPGKLLSEEFNLIKVHPETAFHILKDIKFNMPIADIVYQHHERNNGKGYPQGLMDDEILLEARIIAVADTVEAVSSHRPYRPALGMEKAVDIISSNKDNAYDPEVVKACLSVLSEETH